MRRSPFIDVRFILLGIAAVWMTWQAWPISVGMMPTSDANKPPFLIVSVMAFTHPVADAVSDHVRDQSAQRLVTGQQELAMGSEVTARYDASGAIGLRKHQQTQTADFVESQVPGGVKWIDWGR